MNWILFALLTILLYGIHDILLKYLSGSHALAASLVINISASLGLLCILAFTWLRGGREGIRIPGVDVARLALAGLALGLATVTFMKAFARGAISVVLPFVYVGIILLSVVAGFLLFREKITYVQLIGIALSCVGLVMMVKK